MLLENIFKLRFILILQYKLLGFLLRINKKKKLSKIKRGFSEFFLRELYILEFIVEDTDMNKLAEDIFFSCKMQNFRGNWVKHEEVIPQWLNVVIGKIFIIKFNLIYYDICTNKSKAVTNNLHYLSVLPNFQNNFATSYKKRKKTNSKLVTWKF